MNTIGKIALALGVLLVLGVSCSVIAANTLKPAPSSPAIATFGSYPVEPTKKAEGVFGDGVYQVGVDIPVGRYKTKGPDSEGFMPNCYWERSRADSGDFKDLIANDNVQGPGSVTIKAKEFVKFSGGCDWIKS